MNKPYQKPWTLLACVLVLVGLGALILASVGDYGVSWDEQFRWNGGQTKLDYYKALISGQSDRVDSLRERVDHYPGFFDLPLALVREAYAGEDYWISHLWCAGFGLLGIAGAMALGGRLGGPVGAILAGLMLALYPRYWGHMFINPKDIPFAAIYVWGLWALARMLKPERRDWLSAIVFGLLAGACMSVRVGGLLLFGYAGLFLLVDILVKWRCLGSRTARRSAVEAVRWLLIAALPAFGLLFLFWPALHANPFGQAAETMSAVTSFGWQGQVLFNGQYYNAAELPWRYLPEMLARSAPDWWWWLAVTALVYGLFQIRRWRGAWEGRDLWLTAFAIFFPLGFILTKGSVVYDGARHVLFIIPPAASLIAALSVNAGVAVSARFGQWTLRAWAGVAIALAVLAAWDMAKLHPYQYIYFNRLSGGVAAASGRFETDYWGTAFREAGELLRRELPERQEPWRVTMEPPLDLLAARYGKLVIPPPTLVEPFLGEHIELVRSNHIPAPDFYIASTRNDYDAMRGGIPLVIVKREGVVLVVVKTFAPASAMPLDAGQ